MRLVILGYLAVISLGTLLLSLPISSREEVELVDHFFVSVSAICVTGLSPIDVGVTYSHFGHWVLLILMQVGGLGVMTISTMLILLAGMSPGFNYQSVLLGQFSQDNVSPSLILKVVLPFTFAIEGVGVAAYFFQFPGEGIYNRLFAALFQAISSFCNVGFTLYGDSIRMFVDDPVIVLSTALLVLAGSFGFLAVLELRNIFSSRKKLSLHTKLATLTTVVAVLAGMGVFFCLENGNILSEMSIPQKILSAFSYSSISRTAGISFLDLSGASAGCVMLTIFLMFVGANPGSCGGGIKTTTAAVLLIFAVRNLFLGEERAQIFGRSIPRETVNRAFHILVLGVFVIFVGAAALLICEAGALPYESLGGKFQQLVFEISSAYATCGLSLGATSELSVAGRLIVCLIMFIGRLGPLFLIAAFASHGSDSGLCYSEENIMVG